MQRKTKSNLGKIKAEQNAATSKKEKQKRAATPHNITLASYSTSFGRFS
jgi:hypothetical protein